MLLARLLRRHPGRLPARLVRRHPDGRGGTAGAAVFVCAAMVVLAGCGGSPAGDQVIPGAWRTQNSGTQQRLYDVACLSALRCEAVGEGGTIVSTADGGTTWRARSIRCRGRRTRSTASPASRRAPAMSSPGRTRSS